MIRIKHCTLGTDDLGKDKLNDIEAFIYPEKHNIKIKKNSSLDILLTVYNNAYNYKLKLYDENKTKVLVYNLKLIQETKNYYIYKFELLIIGTHIVEELFNITKAIVNFSLLSNSVLTDNNKELKYKIKNNIKLQITNEKIILQGMNLNEEEIIKLIKNIFELIAIIYGSFPKVNNFTFFNDKDKIQKYAKQTGYLNTSNFDINNNSPLYKFSEISNFDDLYNRYEDLKEKISDLPLEGFFAAQSDITYYLRYKLCNTIQSLEGFCSKIYEKKLKKMCSKEKSYKQKKETIDKLKKYLEEEIETNEEFQNEINTSFGYILTKITLRKYLEYLFEKEYAKIIFNDEIKAKDNSDSVLTKELFMTCSINERNRFSHMYNTEKKKYFTYKQAKLAYTKYILLFRCVIMEELNITVNNELLQKTINNIII